MCFDDPIITVLIRHLPRFKIAGAVLSLFFLCSHALSENRVRGFLGRYLGELRRKKEEEGKKKITESYP